MTDNKTDQAFDIGYLTKAVQDMGTTLSNHTKRSEEQYTQIDERLNKMENQLSFYKTVARTVKVMGASLVALLTIQWADIVQFFTKH